MMSANLLHYEKQAWGKGFPHVVGIDEAGRGPLAGPVVAAAVLFLKHDLAQWEGVFDSKKISAKKREYFFDLLLKHPKVSVGIGEASAKEIDKINILNATHLAMRRALEYVEVKNKSPLYLLIDGLNAPHFPYPAACIVKGDQKSLSIAAASIIAKVTRDRIMQKYSKKYPLYTFEKHKGYPTQAHIAALQQHGPCPIHRYSFRHVATSA